MTIYEMLKEKAISVQKGNNEHYAYKVWGMIDMARGLAAITQSQYEELAVLVVDECIYNLNWIGNLKHAKF